MGGLRFGMAQQSAAPAAYPIFEEVGAYVGGTSVTTIDVPYTGGESNNDIVFLQLSGWGSNVGYNTPSGWTILSEVPSISLDSPIVFWRRCNGTESGSQTVTWTASQNATGIMSRWSGCKTSGDPFEALTDTPLLNASVYTVPSITTLGDTRLAVCLIERYGNTNSGSPSDYTKSFEEQYVAGSSVWYGLSQQIATASVVAADSFTAFSTGNYHTTNFALIPN